MKQYLFLFRGGGEAHHANQSPEEYQAHMPKMGELDGRTGTQEGKMLGARSH